MALETLRIRLAGWIRTIGRAASIVMVLAGVYTAAIGARMSPQMLAVDYYGVTVGIVRVGHLAFRPDEVLILGGVAIMMTGFAIATRTIMDTSRAPAWH